ncbi:nucleoprotein TPR-like isoform X2 [Acanthaster planci]|uniref:Nucleoprotein TPR n=1 Tax=Acanthaster planci TaxID=133434 RepID=A0A8B7Y964_ACAPL|nr:nucleoprotein TPR-like isoform X2 [Acanthaster planci]
MASTMAGEHAELKFLTAVLSSAEIDSVPQNVREKLEALIDSKETAQDGLKTKLEKLKVNSEQRYFELEKQLIASSSKLESSLGSVDELKASNARLEEQLRQSKEDLASIRDSSEGSNLSYKQLSRNVELLEYEKGELLKVLERKNQEISRLNDDWKAMSGKLAEANAAKCNLQVQIDELQNQDMSTKYREKRLEQEKAHLSSQNEWLSQQLKANTDELLVLRKEKSNQILELQGQLNERLDEMKHLQESAEAYKATNKDQEARIEELVVKMKENNEAYAKSEEQFRGELSAQSKLSTLFEKSAAEAQDKVRELITAVEELQKLLGQASTSQEELKTRMQEMAGEHTAQATELNEKIAQLEKELEDANDLLDAARRKGVVMKMSDEELNSLSPTAAAASSFLKSGLTLTQMYSEYVKCSDELEVEKAENQRLNSYLDQILVEIEEKAPIMQKQRDDYEKALQTTNQLSARLDANLVECEQLRVATDEAERRASMSAREIVRLKQQCTDLGHQVRVLLKEVHEAKGGPIRPDLNVSSPDVSSSSNVISEHLVSFRSIEELQAQNEKLLASLRELSDKKEQEEQLTIESKTAGLRQELDSALQDIQEMREARARQTEMVEAIVRQRDMYRVLLQQSGTTPPPISLVKLTSPMASPAFGPPAATTPDTQQDSLPVSTAPATEVKDTAREAMKTLQEEFETYRKEKAENEKLLNEQLETMRKDVSDLRVQNAQLTSQLDFAGERYKILQSNVDGYKKEIASHRDKSQKYSAELVKNQQRINSLTQDLMAANEKLTRAEVACKNLTDERDLLKGVEARLLQEKESMQREHRSQTLLLTNLETIQNNLERSEFESKARLTNQMEAMERELNLLRRRIEGENDQHRVVLKTWEGRVQSLQRQLNHELDNHQKTRESLNKTKTDLQHMKEQCSSVEAQLVAAQIKYESALKDKNEALASRSQQTVVVSSNEEEVRELKTKLRMAEDQVKVLKDQAEKSKKHLEQYKSISAAIETSLKEQSLAAQTYKENMEKRLEETTQAREQLEKQVIELVKERDEMRSEKEELSEAVASQTSELRRNLLHVQEELTLAVQRKTDAETNEATARQDCQEQAKLAKEAQDKYEREFLLHAGDVQQLVTVKDQLESLNAKLAEVEERATKAEDTLSSSKAGWEEQSRIRANELEQRATTCQELTQQNTLLHQQLEELSARMMQSPLQQQKESVDGSLRLPDENKSSEQLLEVIKFLRREKEIAETRSELAQSEGLRLKQRCEHLERQYEEAHRNLTGERERTQVMAQTTAKHQELLKKVETLNALTDSNRMLREEKDRLDQQVQQLEAKVSQLEANIQPLQDQNRELTAERDALTTDKTSLTIEVTRWKQRTNHLIEQCNRADPEEQKKLLAEKDANKKTISSLREENLRHKAELSRLNAQLTSSKNEISKLTTDLANMQSEMKLEQSKLNEEINTLKMDNTAKENDINDKKNTIQQVKKIGRRYKSQYEELQAKVDAEKEQQGQPIAEKDAKIKELEETVAKLTEENKSVKEAEEKTKAQLTERDEREEKSKKLVQGLRQKLAQVNTERNKANEEKTKLQSTLDELRGELSALESLQTQSEGQMEADKKQLQEKVEQLEKDLKQAKENQEKLQTIQKEEQQKQQQQKVQLQARVQELEKQVEEQQKLLQIKHLAPQQPMGAERPSTRSEEPPPTANIKPISSPAPTVSKSSTPSGQRMTASVRPIAVTPVTSALASASATPMATVMPQTQSEASTVVMDADRQQAVQEPLSVETPIVISIASTTPIQAVTPTQQAPPTAAPYPMVVLDARPEGPQEERVEPMQQQEVQRPDNVQEVRAEPRLQPPSQEPVTEPGMDIVGEQSTEAAAEAAIQSLDGNQTESQPPSQQAERDVEELAEMPKPSTSGGSRTELSHKRQREESGEDDSEAAVAEETAHQEKRQRVTPQPQVIEQPDQPLSPVAQSPTQADTTTSSLQQTITLPPAGEDEAGSGVRVPPTSTDESAQDEAGPEDDRVPAQETGEGLLEAEGEDAPPLGEAEVEGDEEPEEGLDVPGEGEEQEEDDDDVVIVVDSDEDDVSDEEDEQSPGDEEDIGDDADEEGEAGDYEDFEDEYPVEGELDYGEGDGEDADEDMEDEDEGEDAVSMEEQEEEGERGGNSEDQVMDDDEVVEISEDDETEGAENEMEVGSSDQQEQSQPMEEHPPLRLPMPELRVEPPGDQVPTSQGQETQIERVPFQHANVPRQRLASLGRAPMFVGAGAPFDDIGDDRQVPSTPTLFVPRRTDGFAEAINSPLLQGRFHFGGSDSEPSRSMAPALAQLATQGDLGLDDTRINLLGGDEDGGRSVPTTPLQTHAPATVLTSSPSSQAQDSSPASQDTSRSVPATSSEPGPPQLQQQQQQGAGDQDEPDTLPSEVPQSSPAPPDTSSEEQVTLPTAEPQRSQGEESTSAVPSAEGAESRDRPEQSGSTESGQGERPKPKRIVWQDSPGSGQSQQRPQQSRGGTAIRSRGRFIQRSFPRGANAGTRGRGGRFTRGRGQPPF